MIGAVAAMAVIGCWQDQASAAKTSTAAAVVNAKIDIIIDGAVQAFDTEPVNLNGSVLVPMRAIFEKLNASMSWDGSKQQVTATKGDTRIVLTINSKTATIGSKTVTLTAAPQIVGGSTMVPLRFVGEALNADVKWVPEKQAVIINSSTSITDDEHSNQGQAELDNEASIQAVINANADAMNREDAAAFLSTFDKPTDTEAKLKAYFAQYDYRYKIISVSNIIVNGSEATADVLRMVDLVETPVSGPSYISMRSQDWLQASLVLVGQEWKIQRFKVIKTEHPPVEELNKLSGELYGLLKRNLLYREQHNERLMLETVDPASPDYTKDWTAAFAEANETYEPSSFQMTESTEDTAKARVVVVRKGAEAEKSTEIWTVVYHKTTDGWKIYSQAMVAATDK